MMTARLWRGPTNPNILESHPDSQSIRFGGRYINMGRMAEQGNLDPGYLSKVMAGKRKPSIDYAVRLVHILGLQGMDELLSHIEDRRLEITEKLLKQVS